MLMWEKPEKVLSKEDWANSGIFDGGPTGGYIPNMSDADRSAWKAKYIKGKFPRVEIRKTTTNGTQILIVVSTGGFPGRNGKAETRSEGKHVRISLNGPAFFSKSEFIQLNLAIDEARRLLEANG